MTKQETRKHILKVLESASEQHTSVTSLCEGIDDLRACQKEIDYLYGKGYIEGIEDNTLESTCKLCFAAITDAGIDFLDRNL